MILAYRNGLLCSCTVLQVEPTRTRVKVCDNKRPQWINTTQNSPRLFDTTDEALDWIEAENQGDKYVRR